MSMAQMFMFWAWLQLPLVGIVLFTCSGGVDELIGRWLRSNFILVGVSFTLWTLYHMIMNWKSLA